MAIERVVLPSTGAAIGTNSRLDVSPHQYFLTGTEALRVTVWSGLLAYTVEITGRVWDAADGQIRPFRQSVTTTAAAAAGQSAEYPLTRGALLNVRIAVTQAPFAGNPVFVRAQLLSASGSVGVVLATLLQGYVTTASDQGWPGSPIMGSLEGHGMLANAGASLAFGPLRGMFTIPAGVRASLVGWGATITTSAVVANRTLSTIVRLAGGVTLFRGVGAAAVPAGTTVAYAVLPGLGPSNIDVSGIAHLPWPADAQLPGQTECWIMVGNEMAGDLLAINPALVRQWIDA